MKTLLYLLVFCLLQIECMAWVGGPRINGVDYPNGATIFIPCGSGTNLTVGAWRSSGLGTADIVGNVSNISGWSKPYCGPSTNYIFCLSSDASSAGTVTFNYSNIGGGYSGSTSFKVSRYPIDLVVSGAGVLCSSNTYTLSGTYTGSVTWSSSNTSIITVNSSTGVATAGATAGPVDIRATITTACGSFTKSRTIHSGKSTVKSIAVNTSMCPGASQLVVADISGSPSYASWSISSGNASNAYLSDYGNGQASFNSYINDCYGLALSMTNVCGSSNYGTTICVDYCRAHYNVYPNPAKDVIAIQFDNYDKANVLPDQITLYSEKSQNEIFTLTNNQIFSLINKEGILNKSVKDLPRGTYYLHVTSTRNFEQQREKIRIQLE